MLLVDDDPDVRAVAAAMLIDAGHIVVEAGSGGAALERLDRDKPLVELMIADIKMPGMNGFELARAARHRRPGLPILFITGFADSLRVEDTASATVLQKPFRADELATKMAAVLAESAARLGPRAAAIAAIRCRGAAARRPLAEREAGDRQPTIRGTTRNRSVSSVFSPEAVISACAWPRWWVWWLKKWVTRRPLGALISRPAALLRTTSGRR